jgi:hypothetical protein
MKDDARIEALPADEREKVIEGQLGTLIKRWHRLRWVSVGVLIVILIAAGASGGYMLQRDQARLRASCNFYADLASAPLSIVSPAVKPAQLQVKILDDARFAFRGEDCTGNLPPAPPGLARWAAYYNLPVPPP